MSDSAPSPSSPRRKRRVRRLAVAFLALFVLLVLAWFIITSQAFFKGFILPRVSNLIGADITVAGAGIRPFSQITLTQLSIRPEGHDPVFEADSIRLRYDLLAILRGNIRVREVTLLSPTLNLVESADGSSNLDSILKKVRDRKRDKPDEESPLMDVARILITNATFRLTTSPTNHANSTRVTEFNDLHFAIDRFANNSTGTVRVGSSARLIDGRNGRLSGRIQGEFHYALDPELLPRETRGDIRLDVHEADGAFRELDSLRAVLNCALTPRELSALNLRFTKPGATLGTVSVTGPLDSENGTGSLSIHIDSIGREALQLVGAPLGIDFGDTALQSTNLLAFDAGWSRIRLHGLLDAQHFSLQQDAGPTPPMDARFTYDLQSVDSRHRLTVSGTSRIDPLAFALDAAYADGRLDLTALKASLPPTARAPRNELTLAGSIQFLRSSIPRGDLVLTADTLDLTDLYDRFIAPTNSSVAPDLPGPPAETLPGLPEAATPPIQLNLQASARQILLRDVELSNLVARLDIDGRRILLDPFTGSLNGAPLNTRLELDPGVSGSGYDFTFSLNRAPLRPLADSFITDARGRYTGELIANARIRGRGVTGLQLRESLTGHASLIFTNAEIQLINPRAELFVVPVARLLGINDITESPLNWIHLQARMGDGSIKLEPLALQSRAFRARALAAIPIADELTHSPVQFPVEFALRRSLAEKSDLLPRDAPRDADYVTLPQFLSVQGTLGDPQPVLDKRVLAGLLLKSSANSLPNLNPAAGNFLRGLGNLLQSGGAPTNSPPETSGGNATPPR